MLGILLCLGLLAGCFGEPAATSGSPSTDGTSASTNATSAADDSTGDSTAANGTTSDPVGSTEDGGATEAGSTTSVPPPELPPDPLVHYRFDGDLIDEAGDHDGTPVGTVTFEPGVEGQAVRLDGASYVDISTFAPELLTVADGMTIVVRFESSANDLGHALLALGDPGDDVSSNLLRVQIVDSRLELVTETGAGEDHVLELAPAPATDEWHGLAIVLHGGMATTYIDGENVGQAAYVPVESQSGTLWIGSSWSMQWFSGLIDDFRVYGEPLNEAQAVAVSAVP